MKQAVDPTVPAFTVTKKGEISNVNLTSTSGYPSIDLYMIELVKGTCPKNTKLGEKGELGKSLVFFKKNS